jgi:hypothetical protein
LIFPETLAAGFASKEKSCLAKTPASLCVPEVRMSDTWYYVRDKKKLGPVAWDQLQQLVRAGQLSPADMILKNGWTKWQAVGEVSGLATPQAAVTDQWFYVQEKKKNGPVTFEQLMELASSGKLLVNDMVLRAGQSKWQHAGDVSGLFPLPSAEETLDDDLEAEEEAYQEDTEELTNEADDEADGEEEEIDVEPYLERARQFQDSGEYARALAEYQELVRLLPTEPEGFNGLAWIMGTCPDARFRNGARAVQYAQRAVKLYAESDEPDVPAGITVAVSAVEYQKTLAAAHAEAGNFAAALAALEAGLANAPAVEKPRLATYRMLYRMRRPYRDLPGPAVTKN